MGVVVAITGVPGVGKTELAKRIAERTGGHAFLEPATPETNPWLDSFYRDPCPDTCFALQFHMMTSAAAQLVQAAAAPSVAVLDQNAEIANNVFITGAHTDRMLTDEQYRMLRSAWGMLRAHPSYFSPEVTVLLEGPRDAVMARIRQRDRASERGVPESYWATLAARYERTLQEREPGRLIRRDIRFFDPMNDPAALDALLEEILPAAVAI